MNDVYEYGFPKGPVIDKFAKHRLSRRGTSSEIGDLATNAQIFDSTEVQTWKPQFDGDTRHLRLLQTTVLVVTDV